MNIVDDFNEKYYVAIKDVLNPNLCKQAVDHFFNLFEANQTVKDDQCPLSDSIYGDSFFDKLLEDLSPFFSEVSGKELIPTYSYARIYRKGEQLLIHSDRPACEISATINVGFSGKNWPIYFNKQNSKEDYSEVIIESGDAILYKGCDIYHWRNEFEGEWLCQIFLHYVDANGPYKDEKYDRRERLGIKKTQENNLDLQPLYYWEFPNVLSHDYCDFIRNKYSNEQMSVGKIGHRDSSNDVNLNIRNVQTILLPLHEDIGAHLIGNSFIANQQAWNFDINMCIQVEYLKYSSGGRYQPHIDTFLANESLQRKLTALAFLNDDFEGGNFFLQISEKKIYPLQTKGTIIVFPSFLLHGVEDVTRGERHSVVCWMSGPKFR